MNGDGAYAKALLCRAGDPSDRKALEQSPQVVETHPTAWVPLVTVGLCGRAERPLFLMDRERFDERGHLMVRADTDEVDLIGHRA